MKKFFWGMMMVPAFFAGCIGRGQNEKTEQEELDSLVTAVVDSAETEVEEQRPMPKAADGLFDDFIFNFTRHSSLQKSRIVFPLLCINDGEKTYMKKSQWRFDKLFADEECFVVIYDNMAQANLENDTSINAASVQWLYLEQSRVKKYNFARIQGQWFLKSVENSALTNADGADFLHFYNKFVNDSAYQYAHVHEPLDFVTVDPDDDFSSIEGTLEVEQWFAFRPQLPRGRVAAINYGQKYSKTGQKVMIMRGVSDSMQSTFSFKKIDGEWKLTAYEN